MTSLPRLVIVGGHGKVALLLAKQASKDYHVTSLVRSKDHFEDITSRGAHPHLLDLEHASVSDLASVFDQSKAVVFSAGAGGKGGQEKTKAIDLLGAIKVCDAIERVSAESRPALYMVSALDTRDLSKPAPSHYTEQDIEQSRKAHEAIGFYYDCKLEADKNIVQRTDFQWTILRPGHLLDDEGTGKVTLGRTHMGGVPRADVAATLFELIKAPGKGAAGLALDLIKGDTPVAEAVSAAISKGETDFQG